MPVIARVSLSHRVEATPARSHSSNPLVLLTSRAGQYAVMKVANIARFALRTTVRLSSELLRFRHAWLEVAGARLLRLWIEHRTWQRRAREYDATVTIVRDTGRTMWIINGCFIIAAVLIGWPLLRTGLSPQSTGTMVLCGFAGATLGVVWMASLERSLHVHSVAIQHARVLEHRLGFSLFSRSTRIEAMNGEPHAAYPDVAAVRWWARALIAGFVLGSLAVGVIGLTAG